MKKRLVLYLVRKKLKLKKYEQFQFANQVNKTDTYFFTRDAVMKRYYTPHWGWLTKRSSVSLNWLLDDECEIKKVNN